MNQDDILKKKPSRQAPTILSDVAFLDIHDVCAAACMSASWIHEEVRSRRFPEPLRFGPRCSRWRSADVRAWLVARAEEGAADADAGALATARAKRASDAAQTKRREAKNAGGDAA